MKKITRMKKYIIFAMACSMAGALFLVNGASAATPTMTSVVTGSGDNVLLNIIGDPNSSVILNYLGVSSIVQMSALGTTNGSGSFSATLSTATYGITPGSLFYVAVNGQRSDSMTWPYSTVSSGSGSIALSQTSASLTLGQTVTITATNNTGGSLYLSTNSNPSVANVALNGNQVSITGNTAGSTSITVCSLANTSNCVTASVTVQSTSAQPITFAQNNVSIGYGQTLSVSVAGGTGTYSVVSNSNPSLIQATINGSVVNIYSNNTSGSAAITVCSANMSSCGVINVTASATVTSSTLTFSQSNPAIVPGSVASIIISGGSGSYYIASNSNASAVQANLVGSTLTLYGNSAGSATLSICASAGGCGTVLATVAIPGATGITLGQANINLSMGQLFNEMISGIGGYRISTNSNPSIASAVINGNTAVITAANTAGTTNITICQSDNQCMIAYVTVASAGINGIVLSPSSITASVGQVSNIAISGSGSYYISGNTNSAVASAAISGNTVAVTAVGVGTTNITICQNGSQCAVLYVTATNASSGTASGNITMSQVISMGQGLNVLLAGGVAPYVISSSPANIVTTNLASGNILMVYAKNPGTAVVTVCSVNNGGCTTVNVVVVNAPAASTALVVTESGSTTKYQFMSPLKLGSTGVEVSELQKRLTEEGVYTGPSNGRYGLQTEAAVKKYQKEHGLRQLGNVGPGTRASLNQ